MSILYVKQPGTVVRLRGESLVIDCPKPTPDAPPLPPVPDVELHRLEVLVLVGAVHATSDALLACSERGISVAYLTRGGACRARLVPAGNLNADLRLRQYTLHQQIDARLGRAVAIVSAKIHNAMVRLGQVSEDHPHRQPLEAASAALRAMRDRLSRQLPEGRDSLLGHEGLAARTYFEALKHAFRGSLCFEARRQHPAPDPVNALLSFGYVLLGNQITGALEARGLDPALGLFHEIHPGRESLALDLLEEFRHPVVDRFVLRLVNLRIFKPEHFEPDAERPGGVRLTSTSLGRFVREWEDSLARPLRAEAADEAGIRPLPVRDRIQFQIERLVADLRGGPAYLPFREHP